MALIKCNECGTWVSDKDKVCPNCGCPMNNIKKNAFSKRALYAILSIALLSVVVALVAYLHHDLAKKEAEAKAEVEMMRKELQEQRTRDSLALVRAEEEKRLAVQKAAEEWAREQEERIEEERVKREGVQKTITLTRILDSHGEIIGVNGNYGGVSYDGMFNFSGYAYTKMITVPDGKVWLYKGYEKIEGHPNHLHLLYFSRETKIYNTVRGYDKAYPLQDGNIPVLRSGDRFRLIFNSSYIEGEHTVYFYFVEKDEDYYY